MKGFMRKKMVATLALSLLLVACDRELPDNKSGKEVSVRVRLVGVSEGGTEDLTRSTSMKEPEEMVTPVGDGMLLKMQMERDTSVLRASKTQLGNTSIFRVIAFKHDTKTFISYGDFTIAGGLVAGGLHVPINDSYDFVCYSYNTTTPLDALNYKQDATMPDSEKISVLQGTKDLLYEKIVDKQVTDVAPELEILLSRLMVRMKIVLDVSYNGWDITSIGNITLTTVNSGGTIQLADGTVAGTGTPTFSSWSGSGSQRESELLVMPKASGSTITVSIPASAIARENLSAIPASAATASFTAELKAGFSYKLLLRLSVPIFARSNIYWDGSKLTFVQAGSDTSKEGWQGVHFKWGSLIGISPAGAFLSYYSSTTPTYARYAKTSYSTWASIPYLESGEITGESGTRGDICRYINSDYRLPKSTEFGTKSGYLSGAPNGWTLNGTYGIASVNDEGTYDLIANGYLYITNSTMGNVRIPSSGARAYDSRFTGMPGTVGEYWTGPGAVRMWFNENEYNVYSGDRSSTAAVRCVKN
jgi:hypothetical protein